MRRLFQVLLSMAALMLIALAYLYFAHRPAPFPAGSESAARLMPGPFAVRRLERRLVDESRPTPANRDFAGSAQRELMTSIWYPEEGRARPLLVHSHGFTSMRENGAYLAEHLASHGFVVVAADYPLTHYGAPGGPNVLDVVNQPGDVSFLIDSLLAMTGQAGHELEGRIDAERIGVLGVSLGGLTSTLVAFHPRWGDPRVRAAISIAGPSSMFTTRFFAEPRLPFLMIAADLDALVPYAANAQDITARVPGGELLTIEGGSHTAFAGRTALLQGLENPDSLGCYAVLKNIEDQGSDDWDGLLGSAEDGVEPAPELAICEMDPLPEAMNVLRQQMITRLAVTAFFERNFAQDPMAREAAGEFLTRALPVEVPEVRYQRAARVSAR